MGAKTKTVGGGASLGAAKDFTNFMSEGLLSGNFGGYTAQQQPTGNSGSGFMGGAFNRMVNQVGQPAGGQAVSSTTGVAGTLNNLLGGNIGDPLNVGSFFQGQYGQGGLQNLPSLGYNAPQWQGGAGAGAVGAGRVASSYQNQDWINTALQNIQLANTQNAPGERLATNLDSEFATGVRGILERQQQKDVADLRARYGIGSSGLGSNAQFAEGNYRAEALPQVAAAMGQINQQEQGIDLSNRQLLADYILGATGLNNQSILGLNSQNLQQGLAQNQFNLGQEGTRAGLALDAAKANQATQLQAAIASKNNMMQLLGMQNQFNMQNAQNQYGADAQNVANMLANQQMGNQYNLGIGQLGLGMQGNVLNAQQTALGQIFNSMNNINALGTPQAQTVQQPSALSQGLGVLTGLTGLATPFFGPGGFFNNGGGQTPTSAVPNFQMPTYQTPQFGTPQFTPSWMPR